MAKYVSICRVGHEFPQMGEPLMLLQPFVILYPEIGGITLSVDDRGCATFVVKRNGIVVSAYLALSKQGVPKPLLVCVKPHFPPVTIQSSQLFQSNVDGEDALCDWLEDGINKLLDS